jgi:hypothetical protein
MLAARDGLIIRVLRLAFVRMGDSRPDGDFLIDHLSVPRSFAVANLTIRGSD